MADADSNYREALDQLRQGFLAVEDVIAAMPDPAERYEAATALVAEMWQFRGRAARIRAWAVHAMTQGMSMAQAAALVGLSRGRVGQMAQAAARSER